MLLENIFNLLDTVLMNIVLVKDILFFVNKILLRLKSTFDLSKIIWLKTYFLCQK